METYGIILTYLEIVNLAAFAAMGVDKHRAGTQRRRFPETALLLMAVIGGSIGALAGMLLFRHKTKKPRFSVGLPVILVMQVLFFLCAILAVSL